MFTAVGLLTNFCVEIMGNLGLILKAAFQHTDSVLELQHFFLKIVLMDKQTNQMKKISIPIFSLSLVSFPDPLPVLEIWDE